MTEDYMTASDAARVLGYTSAESLYKIFRDAARCPERVVKVGRTWIVPVSWVRKRKQRNVDNGVYPDGSTGRPKGQKKIDYQTL